MGAYFPKYFPKNSKPEEIQLRYKRINAILDWVIDGAITDDAPTFEIEKEILEGDKPHSWNVWHDDNMETVSEVDFHKFALAVTKHTGQKLKNMSAFTFYASVALVEEQHQPQNN